MVTKKINIAVFLVGLSGGAGQVVLNYFNNMPDYYQVDVITMHIESKELLQKYMNSNINVYKIPSKKESLLKNMYGMYKILKKKKYDISYAHMTLTNCFPLFVSLLVGIKIRISHSHLAPLKKKNFFERILAKLTSLFATEYIACGEAAGRFLYDKKEFKILKNAIYLNKYESTDYKITRQKERLNLRKKDMVIGHVGRFDKQKNHKFIVNLFKNYLDKYPNTYLVLVGEGILKQEIEKMVESLGITENVLFLGLVDDVYDRLKAFDAFILPSLYEGLSISAVEAQAAGIACVFSDGVSIETDLTSNVEFLSLNDDISKWVEYVHSAVKKENSSRENIYLLQKEGYDIEKEAMKFDKYLMDLLAR